MCREYDSSCIALLWVKPSRLASFLIPVTGVQAAGSSQVISLPKIIKQKVIGKLVHSTLYLGYVPLLLQVPLR